MYQNRLTFLIRITAFVGLVSLSVMPAQAGQAGSCMDQYNITDNSYYADLNCTANESAISSIDLAQPTPGCFDVDDTGIFNMKIGLSGSNTNRYDLGLFINTIGGDARTDAATDACFQEYLAPNTGTVDLTSGIGPFQEFDSTPDSCGDLDSTDLFRNLMEGTSTTDLAEVSLACSDNVDESGDPNPNGLLDISGCTAYANVANQNICTDTSSPGDEGALTPGTKAKCNCSTQDVVPPVPLADTSLTCSCSFDSVDGNFDCTVSGINTAPAALAAIVASADNTDQPGTASFVRYLINDYEQSTTIDAGGSYSNESATLGTVDTSGTLAELVLTPQGGRCTTGSACDNDTAPENYVLGPGQTTALDFTYTPEPGDTGYVVISVAAQRNTEDSSFPDPDTNTIIQETNTDCVVNAAATYAVIIDVSAHTERGQVVVNWETATEAGTRSFDVLRLDANGEYVQVNEDPVPAIGKFGGAHYSTIDSGATRFVPLSYKIVEHEIDGRIREYGPYQVTATAARGAGVAKQVNGSGRAVQKGNFRAMAKKPSAATRQRFAKSRAAKVARQKQHQGGQGAQLKLPISEDGYYSMSAAEIAGLMGLKTKAVKRLISRGRLSLSNQGESIAWEAGNNSIRFFGQGGKTPYSFDNIYWLSAASGTTLNTVRGASLPLANGGQTFTETIHTEKNLLTRPFNVPAPDDDFQYWDFVITGDATFGTRSFNIDTPGAASTGDPATLRILAPFTTGTEQAEIVINGQSAGQMNWIASNVGEITFPQNLLQDANTIDVTGAAGVFIMDSFTIVYQRSYTAQDNQLIFRGGANAVVTVSGFTSSDIAVYDISNPRGPVRVSGLNIDSQGGAFRVTLAPATSGTDYLAVAGSGIQSVMNAEADTPSDLRNPNNSSDYLMVGPAELSVAAQQLANLRTNDGYQPLFVDLADVMDEFNFGNLDPRAIQAFVAYANERWLAPPKALVILGKGHFDYRDEQGHGGNLVPPVAVRTSMAYVAADNLLGDVDADGKPDIPVGRIPVLTAQELTDYVAKLVAYKSAPSGAWNNTAHIVADDTDPSAGDFPADSAAIAALLPTDLNVEETFLFQPYSIANARQRILDGFGSGALFFNLTGHGAPSLFAAEQLLVSADVPNFSNGGRLPVVNALSCLISVYAIPGWQTLGEDLVLHAAGGAIAVWGPMGLSNNNQAVSMGKAVTTALFDAGNEPIGNAYVQGLRAYIDSGGNAELAAVYSLLGDPLVKLRYQTQ